MTHPHFGWTRRSAITALAALPASLLAQVDQVVKLIVASSAGSSIDVVGRTVQPVFSSALGGTVVVENIAGAGSIIAMQTLARARPDGSVLALQTNNMITAPLMTKTAPYDATKDFTPIAMIGSIPIAVVANAAKVPATNAKEWVALMKTQGNKLNYGSSGIGTTLHLAMEQIQDELGIKLNHVPYKGVGPMVSGLLTGEIDFAASALPPVHPHMKTGTLRAIGLLTDQRAAITPDVPTFAEQGFRNFNLDVWMAILAPGNMPVAVVRKVHDAVAATFRQPAIKDQLEKLGNILQVSTPAEALAIIRQDVAKYAALAKKINLAPA